MLDKRLSFDGDTVGYERNRPTYCRELFEAVIDYARLGPGALAVEVGPGTGQATAPILGTGCRVLAVEYGANMADFVARKFEDNPRFEVCNQKFEDFQCASGTVDLLYSATAFHWIPEDIGYPKAFEMLRSAGDATAASGATTAGDATAASGATTASGATSGGSIALFWNRPGPPPSPDSTPASHEPPLSFTARPEDLAMDEAFQAAYARHCGENIAPLNSEQVAARCQGIVDTIRRYGFVEVECRIFYGERRFDADGYVALLDTYSDHRMMPPEARHALYADIKRAINEHGGVMRLMDTMDLYLGRKP